MSKKFSQFTVKDIVADSDYVNVTGSGVNFRVAWPDFLDNIYDRIVTPFIYPTIAALQEAPLRADEDDPVYVRVEETEYRLYKITNIAPGEDDIVLENGNTATAQTEYRDIGFVVGPDSSSIGALATYDNTTGTLLAEGPTPSTVGVNLIEFPDSASDGYFRKKNDNTVELLTGDQLKALLELEQVDNTSDLNKPISTATQAALDLKAPLASPALTGTPTAPTAAANTNTEQLATTAFVQGELTDRIQSVATIADLRDLPTSGGAAVSLMGRDSSGFGGGDFEFKAVDYSAQVGIDPRSGVYIAPNSDLTGASGAWVRKFDGIIEADWFGAREVNSSPGIEAAINYCASIGGGSFGLSSDVEYIIGTSVDLPRIQWKSNVYCVARGARIKAADNSPLTPFFRGHLFFGGEDTTDPTEGVQNAGIIGTLYIDGNRDNITLTTPESGWIGVMIARYAKNLLFDTLIINDCSMDGFYTGTLGFPYVRDDVPTNIVVNKLIVDRAYRNGVSFVDFRNVHVGYMQTTNTQGTAPESGVDVEPNFIDSESTGLYIGHLVTYGNAVSGFCALTHNTVGQEIGTIGRIDAYENGAGVYIYKGHHMKILSGRIHNNVGYGVFLTLGSDFNIRAEIFENGTDGIFGRITTGWADEPDIDGVLTEVAHPSQDWDFSGCLIQNNGAHNVRISGVQANNSSGVPTIYPLNNVNFDGCTINNQRSGAVLSADYGISLNNYTYGVRGQLNIGPHDVAPMLRVGDTESYLVKHRGIRGVTLAAKPAVAAGANTFETVTLRTGIGAATNIQVCLQARPPAGTELTTWSIAGSDARFNASYTNYTAAPVDIPAISTVVSYEVLY